MREPPYLPSIWRTRNVLEDQLRRHRHPAEHPRTRNHPLASSNRRFHLFGQPADIVELWDDDFFSMIERRSHLIGGEGTERLDLQQTDLQPLLGRLSDRFARLRNRSA